jgi:ankyrin repeat protein
MSTFSNLFFNNFDTFPMFFLNFFQTYEAYTAAVASAAVDLDSETDSNHDTALTLACAGGHEELVTLLINRGANIGKFFF